MEPGRIVAVSLAFLIVASAPSASPTQPLAQTRPLRIIAFGANPDVRR